ncbi:MAG: WD40 repeat domain-containing protein [Sulfurimonas sp.]|nr:WD40 repeat domain-containing protein [Sulfurimonas sp.]
MAYSTKFHGVKIFDLETCEIKKSIAHISLNSSVSVSTFSPNGHYFAFANAPFLFIIDIETKELLQKIEVQDEEIQLLSFDATSSYIVAGTKNGRVLQYKTNQSNLLSRLCSFPYEREKSPQKTKDDKNFVSAFTFYKNQFACSGYGGAIFVIDFYTQANKNILTHSKNRVDALCFLDENRLAVGSSDGNVDVVFLNNPHTYKSVRIPILGIKQLLIMPNPNYLMVIGKSNSVAIIDIQNYKITHSRYIEFETTIHSVAISKSDSLVAALENNKIVNVALPGIAKLRSLILQNSLAEAFKLIAKEPMLQGSYEYKMLEEKFEKSYESATKALINQNSALALQIISPYKEIPSKAAKIKELFEAFRHYLRFQALFLEKKYALAYAMCSKYEPLKLTIQYHKMEQVFKLAFSNAQRHILQNNLESAKALLAQYNTVLSKKPLIKLLLTQNREFVALLKAIQKRDFQTINLLIDRNELFKQIPNYIALNSQIEETFQKAEAAIQKGDAEEAKKLLSMLEEIPDVAQKTEELHRKYKHVLALQKAYSENNFIECYEILDVHQHLKFIELGVLLEKHWSKLMQTCEEYALAGNIKGVKKTLGELLALHSRRHKIGDLLRVSFHVRIQTLINAHDFRGAEAIIYTYVDIFGIDSEINHIMKYFELSSSRKLAITEEQSQRPRRDSWRNFDIIMKNP